MALLNWRRRTGLDQLALCNHRPCLGLSPRLTPPLQNPFEPSALQSLCQADSIL